ncbi:5-(carboxyamino)imidazole ribonucleotide synthase [Altererythrobacter sp. SALINAS58]|nr:5-(carboxyamino)imidazole ribonucleotide synthase [Alteripontixanthobacter muriae]
MTVQTIPQGGTIGILGGGQLGRMMAMAAAQLGYRCIGYAPEGDNVASPVCADFFTKDWDDRPALAAFAQKCDVITWEFENVPVDTVKALPQDRVPCGHRALEVAQDRMAEKRFVEGLGGRPAPHAAIHSADDITQAAERIGTPAILKTCREGYDGKGQWRVDSAHDLSGLPTPTQPCVYEGFVRFDAEFSVILARGQNGEIRFWDSALNEHEGGILARSILPAPDHVTRHIEAARDLARQVADALHYVGVLTLEFFATADGPVFNEMAPRVHNSGHWSIEGAATSQFENHIRAICGLPLGDTATLGSVEMRNLIGAETGSAFSLLSDPANHLHLYGKASAREGRKMGHVTRVTRV